MLPIKTAVLVLLLSTSPPDCLAQRESTHTTMPKGGGTFQVADIAAGARTRLLKSLTSLTNPALRSRYRLFIEFGTPLFPPDEQIALDAVRHGGLQDGLQWWLHLPPAERQFDLLILPDVDYFWPADLQIGGNRPLYSTAFILHMEPATNGKTTVHILQINSTVRLGKKFDLLGRTGPKYYWDDRPAPPSPRAARELIEHLTRTTK